MRSSRKPCSVGSKFKYKLEHLELDSGKNWLKDLKKDKDQLRILFNAAQDVSPARDAKLAELKKLIAAKVAEPTTNKLGKRNRKVLVFTAFADTATYLYESLLEWANEGARHPNGPGLRGRRQPRPLSPR